MSTATNDENKAYDRLIKRFPLRPIRDDKQNEQAAEIYDKLIDRSDSLSPAERDYLEVLTDLIAKYESKWDDECAEMSPRELVAYLMEQNNLAQKDLVPEFGSPSRVSEFLKGERRLSLEQAKRLADRFRLNIAALIDKDDSPKATKGSATDFEAPGALYDMHHLSLRDILVHSQPVTYRLFFDALTHVAKEQDKYLLQFLKLPIKEKDFATAYCVIFNVLNLWLIAFKSSKSSTQCALVSEDVDADSYMAFIRPEHMAWENAIRKAPHSKRWLNTHSVGTYGDFLGQIQLLAEQHIHSHPDFWSRSLNPAEGQVAFERFTKDLYDELSSLVQKKSR